MQGSSHIHNYMEILKSHEICQLCKGIATHPTKRRPSTAPALAIATHTSLQGCLQQQLLPHKHLEAFNSHEGC